MAPRPARTNTCKQLSTLLPPPVQHAVINTCTAATTGRLSEGSARRVRKTNRSTKGHAAAGKSNRAGA
eukprot:7177458-Pyramimonas_sp.AAC.1